MGILPLGRGLMTRGEASSRIPGFLQVSFDTRNPTKSPLSKAVQVANCSGLAKSFPEELYPPVHSIMNHHLRYSLMVFYTCSILCHKTHLRFERAGLKRWNPGRNGVEVQLSSHVGLQRDLTSRNTWHSFGFRFLASGNQLLARAHTIPCSATWMLS